MSVKDRSSKPVLVEEERTQTVLTGNFTIKELLEDVVKVAPELKGEFTPDAEGAMEANMVALAKNFPHYTYADFVHLAAAELKLVVRLRLSADKSARQKQPAWDAKGVALRQKRDTIVGRRMQKAAEKAQRDEEQRILSELEAGTFGADEA